MKLDENTARIRYIVLTMALVVVLATGIVEAQEQTDQSLRPITLQLKWHHGSQFAGYYMADAFGLYRAAGLKVDFVERIHGQNPVEPVLSGDADFGIYNSKLLVERARGKPVVVLAALFQKQPLVLVTNKDSGLTSPQDLIGKRLRLPASQGNPIIKAMFLFEGLDLAQVHTRPPENLFSDPLVDLDAGRYDAVAIYLSTLSVDQKTLREKYNLISPATYGVDFYGDCLFTKEAHLENEPDLVEAFRQTTLRGWLVAMNHKETTAQHLKDRFGSQKTISELVCELEAIESLIKPQQVDVGRMNVGRWQHIEQVFKRLEWITDSVDMDAFLYKELWEQDTKGKDVQLLPWGVALAFLALGVLVYVRTQRTQGADQTQSDRSLNKKVTDLRAQNAALERRLSATLETARSHIDEMGAALWDWDIVNQTIAVSDLFLDITGYSREEFGTDPLLSLNRCHPEDMAMVRSVLTSYFKKEIDECAIELRFRCRDDSYVWIHGVGIATWNEEGQATRLVGSCSDITGRVEAEEERDRLFNLSLDLLAVGDFDGFLQQINPAWVRVLGWSRDDLMGHPILFFVHPDDQDETSVALGELESGNPVNALESRFRCRDGSYRWLSWSSFPYPDRKLVFSVVRDITEKKQAESQLFDYQERLRSLSNQLALVEDRQRRQLAEAIHDGLAQQLFAIKAKVTLLNYPDQLEDMGALVQELLDILDDTMRDARNLSFELFPPVLYEVGLEDALTWLAHNFSERTGVSCVVRSEGQGHEMPQDMRAMAYQCVRELLANCYKHAQAERIEITLNHMNEFLTILVDDNGIGFQFSQDEKKKRLSGNEGFGLFSIRERLRSVEGRMLVDSRPGEGCRVFLSFPVPDSSTGS